MTHMVLKEYIFECDYGGCGAQIAIREGDKQDGNVSNISEASEHICGPHGWRRHNGDDLCRVHVHLLEAQQEAAEREQARQEASNIHENVKEKEDS